MSLTTRQLVFIALMAAAFFVLNLMIASGLVAATGIPLLNGMVTMFLVGIWAVLLLKITPKPGVFTLWLLIYSILSLPTFLGGAPGFWPKIVINSASGIAADLVLWSLKYRNWSVFPMFFVLSAANTLSFAGAMHLMGLPQVDRLIAILWWLIPVGWVVGSLGIWLGFVLYKRIQNTAMVKRIVT